MKPSPNLTFSLDQNRIQYQYNPQNPYPHSYSIFDNLNLCPIYERSLSSSFLPMPQLPQSTNSSIEVEQEVLRAKSRSKDVVIWREVDRELKEECQPVSSIVDLGLEMLVPTKKMSTKNVLRNYGNAQNQFILHNQRIQQHLASTLQNKNQFETWIRGLKLLNFEDYQNAWCHLKTDSPKLRFFKNLYKKYCWRFYEQQCIPYIFNSRLTPDNKKSHLMQVHKMMAGLKHPRHFEGFRQ